MHWVPFQSVGPRVFQFLNKRSNQTQMERLDISYDGQKCGSGINWEISSPDLYDYHNDH